MDQQGAGRSRPVAPTRRQPPWPPQEGASPGAGDSTGPLPAWSPEYDPTGSGAQRVLGPGTGPQRLIGPATGPNTVLSRGSGAQPVLNPGTQRLQGSMRGYPPGREPTKPSPVVSPGATGGFSAWHTPADPDEPGQDAYLSDDTTLLSPLPALDDAGQPGPRDLPGPSGPRDLSGPPGRRRGGRPKRRSRFRVGWLALAVVVAAAAGFAGFKFLYEPRVNAPVPPTLRLPTDAPGSPGFDQALGRWQHIGTRTEDPQPLTIAALYPPQFVFNGRSYVRTAASITKTCSLAVYGADLQAALQSGHCTQVVRASYLSGDGTMMGTVGVVNLSTSSAAQKAGQVTGPEEIIAPLSGKKGPTSKLGNGTGVVQAVIKGHYLILMWAEYANLKSPSGSAQRQALEQFAGNLVTGTANINLSTRMLSGKP